MSIQDKQQYLRQNILDKDFDPEEFVKFVTTHFAMDQTQVLNITFDELKMIVNEFVDSQTPKTLTNQHDKNEEDQFGEFGDVEVPKPVYTLDIDWSYLGTPKKSQPKPTVTEQQNKPKKQQVKKPAVNAQLLDMVVKETSPKAQVVMPSLLASEVYSQMFKSSEDNLKIKCVRQTPNAVDALTNVKFLVQDHIVQQNTTTYINKLWGSKQIMYTIITEGRNKQNGATTWQVNRKYTDFCWLRNCLVRKNPGYIIPPLPKQSDIQSAASIISTKNKLNYFLEEVSKQPNLKSSKYFQVFLNYTNYKDFQEYRKNNQNVQKPKSITNLQNPLGEIQCNFSQGLNPFSELISQYGNKASLELKKIKDISKEITVLFYNISLKFTQISQVFTKIKNNTDDISNDSKNQFRPLKKLSKSYQYLSGLMSDHSTMMLKEKDRVNTFFRDYFSYEDNKLKQIKTLIDKRNQFEVLYTKRSAQQIKDVSPGVLSKFSSALFGQKQQCVDSPSSNFKVFKNQFGFFNQQMVRQSLQFADREVLSYSEHFTKYANEYLIHIDEMQQYWSNVIVSLSRLNINALV